MLSGFGPLQVTVVKYVQFESLFTTKVTNDRKTMALYFTGFQILEEAVDFQILWDVFLNLF